MEGLSLGSPAGRGGVGEVSQRETGQGGVTVECERDAMVGESRAGAGAVFLEDHWTVFPGAGKMDASAVKSSCSSC